MQCQDARRLVPAYLDEESSEAQASLLRGHLMDCPACRGTVQEMKALRRWFEPSPAVPVPADFAARVARRAFAGDTGEPVLAPAAPSLAAHGGAVTLRAVPDFFLHLTAVAAAVLCALTIALGVREAPRGGTLRADQLPTVDALLEELDRLNATEDAEATTAEDPEDADVPADPGVAPPDRR